MKYAKKSHGLLIASVVFGAFGFANPATSFGDDSTGPARLTMTIESPSGESSLLTYQQGIGWRFDDQTGRKVPKAQAISTAWAAEPKSADRPLSVLIDGPTGYTYVWAADKGWQYVGHIAARSQ